MPASGLARDCQLPMPASGDPSVTMSSPRPTASPGSPVPNGQSPVSSLVEEPAPSPVPDRHLRRHVPPLAEESAPVTAVVPVSDDWRAGAARPRPTSKHWRLFHEHLAQDPAAKAAFDAIELQGRGKRGKEIDKPKVASLFTFMEENPDLFNVMARIVMASGRYTNENGLRRDHRDADLAATGKLRFVTRRSHPWKQS